MSLASVAFLLYFWEIRLIRQSRFAWTNTLKDVYKRQALIAALGKVRQGTPALSYGSYSELALTNLQFAVARDLDGVRVDVYKRQLQAQ